MFNNKKIIVAYCLISLFLTCIINVSATYNQEEQDNKIFTDFFNGFKQSQNKIFTDKFGHDISNIQKDEILKLIYTSDVNKIKDYLINNNIQLSYREYIKTTDPELKAYPEERGYISDYVYHIEDGIWNGKTTSFRKEWKSTLTSSYRFDPNRNEFISLSSPVLDIDASFGAAFVPYQTLVSTKADFYKNTYILRASYKMWASLGVSIGKFPAGINVNFGYHTDEISGKL